MNSRTLGLLAAAGIVGCILFAANAGRSAADEIYYMPNAARYVPAPAVSTQIMTVGGRRYGAYYPRSYVTPYNAAPYRSYAYRPYMGPYVATPYFYGSPYVNYYGNFGGSPWGGYYRGPMINRGYYW